MPSTGRRMKLGCATLTFPTLSRSACSDPTTVAIDKQAGVKAGLCIGDPHQSVSARIDVGSREPAHLWYTAVTV